MAGSGVEWARQAHAALAELWPPPTRPGADEHDTLVMKEKALIRGDFADDKCVVLIRVVGRGTVHRRSSYNGRVHRRHRRGEGTLR